MSASATPITDAIIRLRDGRTLGYAQVGPSDGYPLFYFHGHQSSRLEVLLWTEMAVTVGVRLMALDRPGIGRSDPKAGYRLLDWPDDVEEVANQLGIERFAVAAASGGGAYGLACAYKIPHRLSACGLICSVAPGDLLPKSAPRRMRTMWWLGEHLPRLYRLSNRLLMATVGSDAASIDKRVARAARFLGKPDREVLQNAQIRRLFAQTLAECTRQGVRGNLDEALLLVQPWGFKVEEIAFEKTFLWHGAQDRFVPVSLAQALAQALPQCTATFYPDEGHLSTPGNYGQDILKTLSSER
jgi:pimeloyl-ACP methyl ester carboxylesterase